MLLTSAATCLALNLYFEARSQDILSQIAVAQVTINRVDSPKFPPTICEVVTQKGQFSWFSDGKSDRPKETEAWKRALKLAQMILKNDVQVTCVGSSTFYHAEYVKPYWAKTLHRSCKVGQHIFYQEVGS